MCAERKLAGVCGREGVVKMQEMLRAQENAEVVWCKARQRRDCAKVCCAEGFLGAALRTVIVGGVQCSAVQRNGGCQRPK